MTKDKEELEPINFDDEFVGPPIAADTGVKPQEIAKVLEKINTEGYGCKFEDLVDKTIVVRSIKPFQGQFGAALYMVGVDENGEFFHTVVGAGVPARKLWQAKDSLPVKCKVVRHESGRGANYFDLE